MRKFTIIILISAIICVNLHVTAFSFTDIKQPGSQIGQGTEKNPVLVHSEADLISKYLVLRGMGLGKLYYKSNDGRMYDAQKLTNMFTHLYPFLISVSSWYEHDKRGEYTQYIEPEFYTPEYVQPSVELADKIAAKIITPDMGYIEKITIIHDYLIDNVDYDWDLYHSNMNDTKNVGFTAYGALSRGLAVCEGYSAAFALLCQSAGIPCYQITGYVEGEPHSWNIIYLYGSLYFVDVTYDDTGGDTYKYFMKSEKEMKQTHTFNRDTNWDAIWNSHNKNLPSAQLLHEINMLNYTEKDFNLDSNPNRAEVAVMLTRLMGLESVALENSYSHPFTDVPYWASDYVGCLYHYGLINGISQNIFGSGNVVSTNDYITFVLRALGYDDSKGDFTWQNSLTAASRIGLIKPDEYTQIEKITRGDMSAIGLRMLVTKDVSGNFIIDNLVEQGIIDGERVEGIRFYLDQLAK